MDEIEVEVEPFGGGGASVGVGRAADRRVAAAIIPADDAGRLDAG